MKNYDSQQIADRVEFHRQLADAYRSVYDKKTAKESEEGATYENWVFAKNCVYFSPYFTQYKELDIGSLSEMNSTTIVESINWEAMALSHKFPDWGPKTFESWPSDHGCVWRTLFSGHHIETGEEMQFYAVSFVETNDKGEITRWETWPDNRFDPFLKEAIGICGPWDTVTGYFAAIQSFVKGGFVPLEPAEEGSCLSIKSKIRELMDDPDTLAVLEKNMGKVIHGSGMELAMDLSLDQMFSLATEEQLASQGLNKDMVSLIDKDLQTLCRK